MRLRIDRKKRQANIEIDSPRLKEGLGWLTDDRKMEREGREERQWGIKPERQGRQPK